MPRLLYLTTNLCWKMPKHMWFSNADLLPVSAFIMQRNGAGVHAAQSCFWDGANDNVARVVWPPINQREQGNSHMCAAILLKCSHPLAVLA